MKFFAWLVACTALVSSVGCTASEYDVAQMEAEQAATSSPPARTGCSRAEWQAINAALEAARQQVDNLAMDFNQRCNDRISRAWFQCLCNPNGFEDGVVPKDCMGMGYSGCERVISEITCDGDFRDLSLRACRQQLDALNSYARCAGKPGWEVNTIYTPRGPVSCDNIPLE